MLGALVVPGTAAAHITLQPSASRPAELQRYRLIVPNESETAATTGVDLRLPAGITLTFVEAAPGWRTKVVRSGSEVGQIRWRAGRVPPGGYAELHFIARNPVKTGTVQFKALQRYDDGTVVRWIGASSSETPAPTTRLSESAVPDDVVSTHGQTVPAGARPAVAATGSAQATQSDRDTLTLVIAIAAAMIAAAALALQLTRRRRS